MFASTQRAKRYICGPKFTPVMVAETGVRKATVSPSVSPTVAAMLGVEKSSASKSVHGPVGTFVTPTLCVVEIGPYPRDRAT